MIIRIDITRAEFELVLNPSKPAHHYIEGDATVSRTYSALTLGQFQRLYLNTTGFALDCTNYSAALQACKFLAIRLLTESKGGSSYDLEKEAGEENAACEASE